MPTDKVISTTAFFSISFATNCAFGTRNAYRKKEHFLKRGNEDLNLQVSQVRFILGNSNPKVDAIVDNVSLCKDRTRKRVPITLCFTCDAFTIVRIIVVV